MRSKHFVRVATVAMAANCAILAAIPARAAVPISAPCRSAATYRTTAELIASGDIAALRVAAAAANKRSPEYELLQALIASYVMNQGEAATRLRRYLARPGQSFAFEAATVLAGVEARSGRYAEAAAAIRTGLASGGSDPARADDVSSARQMLSVMEALSATPPLQGPAATRGSLTVTRDLAGLAIGHVTIDGRLQPAVLDTGANFSVIVRSKADSLGLRLLPPTVTIASPTAAATPARLAIADRLVIGGAVFRNVVFIVFPDEALTFAEGRYKIEAILGFPVLARLGRLQFSSAGTAEALSFVRDTARRSVIPAQANLFVENLTPKIVACVAPQMTAIQFKIDSGANTTSLRPLFATTFPALVAGAKATTARMGSVGATVERVQRVVPSLALDFGGTTLTLKDIDLNGEETVKIGDHGRLGQDALRAKGGYVLDFTRMRFELRGD